MTENQHHPSHQNPVDERIAPQAPRGQETYAPSPTGFGGMSKRRKHFAVAAVVFALVAICASLLAECNTAAQQPMLINATGADDAASPVEEESEQSPGAQAADEAARTQEDASTASSSSVKKAQGSKKSGKASGSKSSKTAASNSDDKAKDEAATSESTSKRNEASSKSGKSSDYSQRKSGKKKAAGKSGASSGNSASSEGDCITVSIAFDGSRAGSQDSASAAARSVTVKKGASVYDALVASGVSIAGDSTYVSSIGGLAEFQCGSGSGWMYSVDGVFPNVSCGKYTLNGGEEIVWAYTLDLGEDVK